MTEHDEPERTSPGKKRRRPRAHPLARTGPWMLLGAVVVIVLLAGAAWMILGQA